MCGLEGQVDSCEYERRVYDVWPHFRHSDVFLQETPSWILRISCALHQFHLVVQKEYQLVALKRLFLGWFHCSGFLSFTSVQPDLRDESYLFKNYGHPLVVHEEAGNVLREVSCAHFQVHR